VVVGAGSLLEAIERHSRYTLGLPWGNLTSHEKLVAVSLAVRERLIDGGLETEARYRQEGAKRAYYLSAEFLIGRSLLNNLVNLGMLEECKRALESKGTRLEDLCEVEEDAALGNGGLGRLVWLWHQLRVRAFQTGNPEFGASGKARCLAEVGPITMAN
jgi:starch phosphorylase